MPRRPQSTPAHRLQPLRRRPRPQSGTSSAKLGHERPLGPERVPQPACRQPQVPGPPRPDEQCRPSYPTRLAVPGSDPTADRRDGPDFGGGKPHRDTITGSAASGSPITGLVTGSPSPRADRHSTWGQLGVARQRQLRRPASTTSSEHSTPTTHPAAPADLREHTKDQDKPQERDDSMPVISLAAADSGISTMQTEIDTIGNNVANADSDGYQEADVQFSDILTQELAPGSGASPAWPAPTQPRSAPAHRSPPCRRTSPRAPSSRPECPPMPPSRGTGSLWSPREATPTTPVTGTSSSMSTALSPPPTAPSCRAGPGPPPRQDPPGRSPSRAA